MPNGQFLEILVLAVVAAVILFRLYTVLGRRTGHEPPPRESYRLSGNAPADAARPDNVVPLPSRAEQIADRPADPVARGLFDIKLADRTFETSHFLSGARAAYEMIVTAFADGDRRTLKNLLSREVYEGFEAAIGEREKRGETMESHFVSIDNAEITAAEMRGRTAQLTVRFHCKLVSATRDKDGNVIDGNAEKVTDVTDVWTFARDLSSRDPNWKLVATEAGQ